jgi:uncharacterized membrane protein YwaF
LESFEAQYALFIIFSGSIFFLVDKIGRRTLLVYRAIVMGACHMVFGGVLGANYEFVPGKQPLHNFCESKDSDLV